VSLELNKEDLENENRIRMLPNNSKKRIARARMFTFTSLVVCAAHTTRLVKVMRYPKKIELRAFHGMETRPIFQHNEECHIRLAV